MTRTRVQLLIFAVFLTVASSISIDSGVQIKKWEEITLEAEEDKPNQEKYLYQVKNKKGVPCILANMSINVTVPYNIKSETKNSTLTVSPDAVVTGICSDTISEMKLSWKAKEDEEKYNSISFTFIDDHTSFSLFSVNASIYLDKTNFPNAAENKELSFKSTNDLRLFAASVENGRHTCTEKNVIKIGDAELILNNVILIAFNSGINTSSRQEEKCGEQKKQTATFPYAVKDKTGKICTLAKMSIVLEIPYSTQESNDIKKPIKVPIDAKVSGECGIELSRMTLTWTEKSPTFAANGENSVLFKLLKKDGLTYIDSIAFDIFLDEKNFPGAGGGRVKGQTMDMDFDGIFKTAENGVYSCKNETTIGIGSSTMNISDVLLVAFDAQQDFWSKTVVNCNTKHVLSEQNFNYVLKTNEKSVACILANMTISVKVPYTTSDSKTDNVILTVPSKTNVTGSCGSALQTMSITWTEPKATISNTINFHIYHNSTRFFVLVIDAEIYLDKEHFSNAADKEKVISYQTDVLGDLFAADLHTGLYNCEKNQTIQVGSIELTINDTALVAFNKDDELESRKAENCSETPNTPATPPTTVTTESTSQSTESTESSSTSSPTPPPLPPDPSVKKFKYYQVDPGTGIACSMANMTISLKVSYETKNSGSKTTTLKVPNDASTEVKCGKEESTMDLTWTTKDGTYFDAVDTKNAIKFNFHQQNNKFFLHSVIARIYMDEKHFPNATMGNSAYEAASKTLNLFSTPVKQLYRCAPATSINVDRVDVTLTDVALIAFNTEQSVSSRSEVNCVVPAESSNVGVIIGTVIAAIAVIGLIAAAVTWFIRRRRVV